MSRRAAALVTVVLLVLGLGVGGLMAAGRLTTPDWVHPSQDRAAGRASILEPVASGLDPATDQDAPQRDPRGLMMALSTLRADLMTSGELTDLARLDASGSEALAQDTALLKGLAASGQSWQGVALTVTSARSVTHTATSATVDAVVETSAYRLVDRSGHAQQRPAVAGEEMRFALVWSAGRWRVASIAKATS
jgi:hypothetical protein